MTGEDGRRRGRRARRTGWSGRRARLVLVLGATAPAVVIPVPARAADSLRTLAVQASFDVPDGSETLMAKARDRRLVIAPPLLSKLQTLADGLVSEIVLCLRGSKADGFARATEFVMPVPQASTPTRSTVAKCPEDTIAVWHNHSLSSRSARGWGAPRTFTEPPRRPLDLCRLSGQDIETMARSEYSFAVISVDRDTWCWWTNEQVRVLWKAGRSPGYPLAGQFHEVSNRSHP
jgi:hypothetical protein